MIPKAGSDSILKRVLRETVSFGVLQTVGQIVLWIANLVLARVLSPKDFGVYDICTFFLALGTLLGDAGLGAALLRTPDEPTREQYESVFFISVLAGGVLAVALAVLSPFLAARYGLDASARWMLIAMTPVYVLSSLRAYPTIRIERDLAFGLIARIELVVLLLKQAVAVTLAVLGFGVWALVLASIAAALLTVVFTLWARPGLPMPRLHRGVLKPLLSFGLKVQALGFVAFFKDNVANALLGVLGGPVVVGLFNFAVRYIQVPVLAVNALARVQLPTYARLQNDPVALGGAVRGALRITFLAGIPFLVVLACGSSYLIPLLYGARWLPAIPAVWAMVPNMIGGLAAGPLFTLLQARGEAGVALTTFIAWTLSTWVLAAASWFLGWGIQGIGIAHSVVTIVITTWLLLRAQKTLGSPLVRAVGAPMLSGCAAVAVHAVSLRLPGTMGVLAHHPAALLTIPLTFYVINEWLFEGRSVVSEFRSLLAMARAS